MEGNKKGSLAEMINFGGKNKPKETSKGYSDEKMKKNKKMEFSKALAEKMKKKKKK